MARREGRKDVMVATTREKILGVKLTGFYDGWEMKEVLKIMLVFLTSVMVDRGENTGRNSGLEYIGITSSAANMLSLDVFEIS